MADTVSSKSTNDDHNQTVLGNEHISQDVNTDERYSVGGADFRDITNWNQKRTGDLHQTLDADGIHRSRRQEDEERQMRLRHAEAEFNQRLKHDNDLHVIRLQTMQVGSVGSSSIIRDIAQQTVDEVIAAVQARK